MGTTTNEVSFIDQQIQVNVDNNLLKSYLSQINQRYYMPFLLF